MSQVLITGATGLVGGHLLRMLINEPKVNAIAAPTRRPLGDMPGCLIPMIRTDRRAGAGHRSHRHCVLLSRHHAARSGE